MRHVRTSAAWALAIIAAGCCGTETQVCCPCQREAPSAAPATPDTRPPAPYEEAPAANPAPSPDPSVPRSPMPPDRMPEAPEPDNPVTLLGIE